MLMFDCPLGMGRDRLSRQGGNGLSAAPDRAGFAGVQARARKGALDPHGASPRFPTTVPAFRPDKRPEPSFLPSRSSRDDGTIPQNHSGRQGNLCTLSLCPLTSLSVLAILGP